MANGMVVIRCIDCNADVERTGNRQLRCVQCRKKRKQTISICCGCSRVITETGRGRKRKWCDECLGENRTKYWRIKHDAKLARLGKSRKGEKQDEWFECVICRGAFKKKPGRIPRTCSKECGVKASAIAHKAFYTPIQCKFCGSVFHPEFHVWKKHQHGRDVYCDNECANAAKAYVYRTTAYSARSMLDAKAAFRTVIDALERIYKKQALVKCCGVCWDLFCGSGAFCKKCKREAEKRKIAVCKRRKYKPKVGKYLVCCEECRKEKVFSKYARRTYCSKRCAKKARSKRRDHLKRCNGNGADRIGMHALRKKYNNTCNRCGVVCITAKGFNDPREATLDHVMPLSKGGSHTWDNVQLLCRQCNTRKSDKVDDHASERGL